MTPAPDAALFLRLRRRLALLIALVIAAILAVLVGGVILVMDQALLAQQADVLRAAAMDSVGEIHVAGGQTRLSSDPDDAGTVFLAWGAGGRFLASTLTTGASATSVDFAPAAQAALGGLDAVSQVEVTGAKGTIQYLVASESVHTKSFDGVIQAARSLTSIRAAEDRLTWLLLAAAGGGVVLAAIGGWYLAGRAMRPTQIAFRRQREFAADASHELRTPLAVLDAGLQILARHPEQPVAEHSRTLIAMRAQAARMTTLVGDLLTLARADAGQAGLVEGPVDLAALVAETVAQFQPLAAERGASVRTERSDGGVIRADHDRLAEALGTLVHNAIDHGGEGIQVDVGTWREAGRDGERAVIEVRDDGPGVAEQDRSRLTDRFWRGSAGRARRGSGLGLAIARWVASAHGGRLELADASPGSARPGLRARIELPVRQS